MSNRLSINVAAFAVAVLVNLSMLASVDHLATARHVATQLAKTDGASSAAASSNVTREG